MQASYNYARAESPVKPTDGNLILLGFFYLINNVPGVEKPASRTPEVRSVKRVISAGPCVSSVNLGMKMSLEGRRGRSRRRGLIDGGEVRGRI